ncbi:ATP/GTP-binding protein [Flavobacterium sp. LM4]|uniref:AAA family ATPase n=1 Tax=Flavobacterium sp. LM4 TaxID=1938609 RepID=UPI00099373C8|nr:ATP-binding protein [Flavobacterium sp. LM4]OOV17767.1 hypothetical protein BXU10_17085 [Flavobacterium sp. LM4]
MLIEISITNFRSFREKQTFSLLPFGKIRNREIKVLQPENYPKVQILPSAILYGPNNSGKSNFIKAFQALEWLVLKSGNFNSDQKLHANEYFHFDKQTKEKPSTFELDFIAPNRKRYNYQVTFGEKSIIKEYLYSYNITNTGKIALNTLFERNEQAIKFIALKGAKESVNFEPNQLFLSRGDIAGNAELKDVYSFFSNQVISLTFTETEYTNFLTRKYGEFIIDNPNSKISTLVESILQETNSGILGIETNMVDISKINFPDDISQEIKDKLFEQIKYDLRSKHKLFDGDSEIGIDTIPLKEQSTGTRKLIGISPVILNALLNGQVLLIDEMNTSLHTEITSWLIELFNNPITNPNNAQLIITTHDISLLDRNLYERDQIYAIEKNEFGASNMYSFAEFTGLRKIDNNRLADFYETGRLGGLPHIAKPYLENLISQFIQDGETE